MKQRKNRKTEIELQLETLNNDQRTALLGEQVKRFIEADVGKYLLQRADALAESARTKLSTADPENPKLIREYQNEISIASHFVIWLEQAIDRGEVAIHNLESKKEYDNETE